MATGAALRLAGDACASCPAREGRCVPPEPAMRRDDEGRVRLAIVGEGPGRTEIETGRPFSGASGRMLGRGLRSIQLQRPDAHWTNAVLCDCAEEDLPAARRACSERLIAELSDVAPRVVMPVGAFGLQSSLRLTKKPKILAWRGSVSKIAVSASPAGVPAIALVAPTIHPAFVMRAPKWGPVLELDVARVGRLIRDGFEAPEDAPWRRFVVAKTQTDLEEELSRLGRTVSFDVETVGLGPTYTGLVCYGLSDGTNTLVIPWSKTSNGIEPFWSSPPSVIAMTSEALSSRVCVTHNGPAFDHIVAARYGIRIGAWEDTLLATHATDGHLPKNLAQVVTTTEGLDVPPWKQLEDRGADIERLWFYNGRDCLYTILAWLKRKEAVT